jgi:hypothetical protein
LEGCPEGKLGKEVGDEVGLLRGIKVGLEFG